MPERASITAEIVALVRAREQARPKAARIVDDPFAPRFLERTGLRVALGGGPDGALAIGADLVLRLPLVGVAATVLGRHRIMDDHLLAETAAGASQCVILGAGYDARPYRFPPPVGPARFFEVDHPTLSSRKRDLVTEVLGGPPAHVSFVAADLLEERLDERLCAEGYDRAARTVFICEGVTYYLTPRVVGEMLGTVRALAAPGSTIILDAWANLPGARGAFLGFPRLVARFLGHAVAEPFLFSLESPDGANALLERAGFEVPFACGAERVRALFGAHGRRALYLPPYLVIVVGRVH